MVKIQLYRIYEFLIVADARYPSFLWISQPPEAPCGCIDVYIVRILSNIPKLWIPRIRVLAHSPASGTVEFATGSLPPFWFWCIPMTHSTKLPRVQYHLRKIDVARSQNSLAFPQGPGSSGSSHHARLCRWGLYKRLELCCPNR